MTATWHRKHFAEIRLPLEFEGREVVRAFIREAALADHVPSAVSSAIAADASEIWHALCVPGAAADTACLFLSSTHTSTTVRFALKGHSRFSSILPQLAGRIRENAGLSYKELGIDGWEISLHRTFEFAPHAHVSMAAEHIDAPALAVATATSIDVPHKGDCSAIARCFLAVYGHNYVHPEVFSPVRYWRKVEAGELIPVIARDDSGDAAGHVALEREPGSVIAERGQAVVLPAYRGRHLLEKMTERLTEEAVRLGLAGIYAMPVTTHTFSQRNDERAGMPPCAVLLGAAPETSHSKDLPVPTAGQRQSFLITFRFMNPPAAREICVPDDYRDTIAEIYKSLGVTVSHRDGSLPEASASSTAVKVDHRGYGKIHFERIGANSSVELAQALCDVRGLGARTVQLSAPIDEPGLVPLIEAARSAGFFFCGVGPAFANGRDTLLLQRLDEPLDVEKLQLFSDTTKKLAAFIDEDRSRTRGRTPA
jgi:hypothetical protein